MDRIITLLCALLVAGALAWALDRSPVIDYRLPTPIIHPHLRWPGGMVTRQQTVIADLQSRLGIERESTQKLKAALEGQLASMRAQSARDAADLADSQRRLAMAQAQSRDAEAVAARLLRPLKAADRCGRADEALERLRDTLP